MRSYGEKITDQTIIENVLRSLTPKFDHAVAAIEEYMDLSVFSFDELMGSLQVHESRINRSLKKNEEKTFQMKEAVSKLGEIEISTTKGHGRGGFRGHGRGRGFGRGRGRAYCPNKDQQVNYAAENEKESKLFMVHSNTDNNSSGVWFVDSGCSNHMTDTKSMFKELDETQKVKVQLGNGKDVQVEWKGTIGIETTNGKIKLLRNIQFVPDLGYNLLSVGQLMSCGYSISFDNGECVIKEKNSGNTLITINMTQNKMFPLEVSRIENFVLVADEKVDSIL
ncbi:uncharacterized protein LOC142538514 [Primulina tabacum]|uniref:uncharacterized protein LOC142538514 n=1 Tax=Primulina tabacum TaxID=48773 RepID=UPI003F591969